MLSAARLLSAALNIIHDCDEVFNYWEPLHYLLYGYGMQTWEYSQQYALRSYLYLLLHLPVAAPLAAVLGATGGVCMVHRRNILQPRAPPSDGSSQARSWCFTQCAVLWRLPLLAVRRCCTGVQPVQRVFPPSTTHHLCT